jgi:hypothetical protein
VLAFSERRLVRMRCEFIQDNQLLYSDEIACAVKT